MTRHSAVRLGIVTLAAAALAACTDRPGLLEPTGAAPEFSSTGSGSTLKAKKRAVSLASALSATQAIGRDGGTIQIGDWSVVIPRSALSKTVSITVTVPAGDYHWIKFEPDGLEFKKTVTVSVSASGADSWGTLYSAYIGQDFDPKGTPVLELLSASGTSTGVQFGIKHFSGYVIATGEGDGTTSSLDLATMTMTDTSSSGYIVVTGDE